MVRCCLTISTQDVEWNGHGLSENTVQAFALRDGELQKASAQKTRNQG
jgi:hypothetical protein